MRYPIQMENMRAAKRALSTAPKALELLKAVEREAENATIQARVKYEHRQELIDRKNEKQILIAREMDEKTNGGSRWTAEDNKRLASLKAEVDELKAQLAESEYEAPRQKLSREEIARHSARDKLRGAKLEELIRPSANLRFGDASIELPPKMTRAAIEKGLAQAVTDRVALDEMMPDEETIGAAIEAEVASVARGPTLGQILKSRPGARLGWPISIDADAPDAAMALMCWLHGDEIVAKLKAEARERVGDKVRISPAARRQREVELSEEFLRLERFLVRVCRSNDEPVPIDVSALAYFEIEQIDDHVPAVHADAGGVDVSGGVATIGAPYGSGFDQTMLPGAVRAAAKK